MCENLHDCWGKKDENDLPEMQLSETQYGQNEDCYDPAALNILSMVYKQTVKTGKMWRNRKIGQKQSLK